MKRADTHGYTLLEMALAVAVLGMLTGMMLTVLTGQSEAKALKEQKAQMKLLDEALAYHVKLRGRLPCPANPALPETDANFAREDCTLATIAGASANEDIYIGALPTRTLNIADRHLYDAWGSRISYAVVAPLTVDKVSFDGYATTEDTGVIAITDAAGNPMTQQLPENVVAYALLSHGKDKAGGYNRVGTMTIACNATALDGANCDAADNLFMDAEINDSRFTNTYYHDMLRWMDLAQLRNAVTSEEDGEAVFMWVLESGNNRLQKFDSTYNFVSSFGGLGTGDGEFDQPYEFTSDDNGNLYVTENNNNRVQVFSSSGTFLRKFGSFGSADGQFNAPAGIAVDSSGNIFVADRNNHRIQKFDNNGNFLMKFGSSGSGDGQFNGAAGLAVDESNNIYVAETHNHRIQKFDNNGNFLMKFGSSGSGDGQFNTPQTVGIQSNGNIWVADTDNHRFQIFDSTGVYLSQFGSFGTGDGQFNNPEGPVFDDDGNAYIADCNNNRIQIFDSSGMFLGKFGTAGSGNGEFNIPEGLVVVNE